MIIMNNKNFINLFVLLFFILFLNGCQTVKKANKPFKHNTPLIKDDVRKKGKTEVAKTIDMGPKPVEGDTRKLEKRKKISSESQRNYLLIPDSFPMLKQRVTLKFKNLDFKETMKLMGKIGEINVLVGDEVAGVKSDRAVH